MRGIGFALALLVLLGSVAAFAQQDSPEASRADRIAAVKAEYDEAMQAFMKEYRSVSTDAERQKIYAESYPKAPAFAKRIMTIAAEDPADKGVVDGLAWVAQNAQGREKKMAVKFLVGEHADHESLGQICMSMIYAQDRDAASLVQKIHDASPHRSVKGQACFALAAMAHRMDQREKALEHYKTVVAQYADVSGMRGSIGDAAKSAIFELENLAIGMTAPEINGEDIDGVGFKLSDYRGKVVFLDFWGDW